MLARKESLPCLFGFASLNCDFTRTLSHLRTLFRTPSLICEGETRGRWEGYLNSKYMYLKFKYMYLNFKYNVPRSRSRRPANEP